MTPSSFHPRSLPALVLLFAGVFLGSGPTAVNAETTAASGATEITAVPCTIDQPGTYFLKQDFSVSNQTAVTITASNVTLDLNGHTLSNTFGAGTAAQAIYATGDNVRVHGGRTAGFFYGATVVGNNSRVEDMAIAQAYYIGICSGGHDNIVRRCRVTNVGGTTYYGIPDAYGIIVSAYNAKLIDCDVKGVTPNGGLGPGVYFASTHGQSIGNRITSCQIGFHIIYGTDIKYRDNLCTGVTTPYYVSSAAIDAGNNQ